MSETAATDILVEMRRLEQAYCRYLVSDEGGEELLEETRLFFDASAAFLAAEHAPQEVRIQLRHFAQRVQIISSECSALAQQCSTIREDLALSTRNVIVGMTPSSVSTSGSEPEEEVEARFKPLRHWFLAHFDYPYPDENAYTFLGGQVPSMTRSQIATWFINARRRSGWTDFRRDFAEEDYYNFQRLLATIDEPQNATAKKRYDKVRLYFEPARKDVVSETILEVIKQGAPKDLPPQHTLARAVQRVKKRAARGVGARHDEEDELAPAVQGSWSPRRRNELPAAASSLSPAPPFNPIVDVHRNTIPSPGSNALPGLGLPRFPSAFVSPATSARSFSESSSSSLDSLVSYGSSDYAPQTVRMEHTMPFHGVPAISVPPNQQQPTSSSQTLGLPALHFPRMPPGPSTFSSPTRPHPYFCTLNELPTVPNFRGGFANVTPR